MKDDILELQKQYLRLVSILYPNKKVYLPKTVDGLTRWIAKLRKTLQIRKRKIYAL